METSAPFAMPMNGSFHEKNPAKDQLGRARWWDIFSLLYPEHPKALVIFAVLTLPTAMPAQAPFASALRLAQTMQFQPMFDASGAAFVIDILGHRIQEAKRRFLGRSQFRSLALTSACAFLTALSLVRPPPVLSGSVNTWRK